jgi:hypothetical protein
MSESDLCWEGRRCLAWSPSLPHRALPPGYSRSSSPAHKILIKHLKLTTKLCIYVRFRLKEKWRDISKPDPEPQLL